MSSFRSDAGTAGFGETDVGRPIVHHVLDDVIPDVQMLSSSVEDTNHIRPAVKFNELIKLFVVVGGELFGASRLNQSSHDFLQPFM